MPKRSTFGGLGDMPHPTPTRVKVPRMQVAPRPKTLADVVTKMDEIETENLNGPDIWDYEAGWTELRNWLEAHS